MTCHTTGDGGPRNPYGHALEGILQKSAASQLTAAMLHQADSLDSDGDGTTNEDEIKAGRLPGRPDSAAAPTAAAAGETENKAPEFLPKHSFHPIMVHFPIALFLFGAALDAWGVIKRRAALRDVAQWNMIVGAVSGVAGIATGLTAAFRLGYSLTPGQPVFLHLATAILATLLMGVVAFKQAKQRPVGVAYLILLGLAAALVGFAGHLGGGLVYG